MSLVQKPIWTTTLVNDTLTIDASFCLTQISMILISGTGSFIGTYQAGSIPSSQVPLSVGVGTTVGTGTNALLESITITTTGTVAIIGR